MSRIIERDYSQGRLGSTQLLAEMITKEFPWGYAQLVRRADNSAILVVPNVKARMEAERSILPLSLHDFLQESFTFTL